LVHPTNSCHCAIASAASQQDEPAVGVPYEPPWAFVERAHDTLVPTERESLTDNLLKNRHGCSRSGIVEQHLIQVAAVELDYRRLRAPGKERLAGCGSL
jgi:hypothetical protein